MSINKWYSIWNSKNIDDTELTGNEFEKFCVLKRANGFDVAVENEQQYFQSFYQGWLAFFSTVMDLVGPDIKSVYEVGCGSGVNLFMFKNRLQDACWGGCDYSEALVKGAVLTTGSNDFVCCGADEICTEPKYDIVMAESVFQYFESEKYAETVLRKMIEKSEKLTYLGEVHNKLYEEVLMEERKKIIENYNERYEGLNKLFLRKEWLKSIAEEYNKKILFTEVDNPEYLNGKYEFNCYIYS